MLIVYVGDDRSAVKVRHGESRLGSLYADPETIIDEQSNDQQLMTELWCLRPQMHRGARAKNFLTICETTWAAADASNAILAPS